jgi:PAS domain S-box-containing protein
MDNNAELLDKEVNTGDDKKYFNRIQLMICFVILIYLPVFYFTKMMISFWWLFWIALIMNPIIYFVHKWNYSNAARLILVIACNAGVFFTSLGMGHFTGSEQYSFCYMILTVLLYNRRNTSQVWFGNVLCLITAWLIFHKVGLSFIPPQALAHIPVEEIRQVNFFGTAFLLGTFVLFFLEDSKAQQNRMSKLLGTSNLNFFKLKECENELLQIKNSINYSVMVMETNASGRIIYVNDHFCKLTGYSRSELQRQNYAFLHSEIHSNPLYHEMWATLKKGEVWTGLISNQSKQGKPYYLGAVITPIKNVDGEISKYFAVYFNQSDLRDTQHSLDLAQEKMGFGLWSFDLESQSLVLSKPLCNMLGLDNTKKDYQLKDLFAFVHETDRTQLHAFYKKTLADGTPFEARFKYVKEGKPLGLKIYLFVMASKTGQLQSLYGLCQNLSEIVKSEELAQIEKFKALHYAKLASQQS